MLKFKGNSIEENIDANQKSPLFNTQNINKNSMTRLLNTKYMRRKQKKLKDKEILNNLTSLKNFNRPTENIKTNVSVWPSFNTDEELLETDNHEFLKFDSVKRRKKPEKGFVRKIFSERRVPRSKPKISRNIKIRSIGTTSNNSRVLNENKAISSQKNFTETEDIQKLMSLQNKRRIKRRLFSAEQHKSRNCTENNIKNIYCKFSSTAPNLFVANMNFRPKTEEKSQINIVESS